jgi:hypothetical protein
MNVPSMVVAAIIAAAAPAAPSAESLATIGEAEVASLDANSIQSRGGVQRFDVRVSWRDAQKRPAGAAASRVVRYLARCEQGTMALAAVATLDDNGRMLKSHVVPPGGAEYAAPVAGSREAHWLQDACSH